MSELEKEFMLRIEEESIFESIDGERDLLFDIVDSLYTENTN